MRFCYLLSSQVGAYLGYSVSCCKWQVYFKLSNLRLPFFKNVGTKLTSTQSQLYFNLFFQKSEVH